MKKLIYLCPLFCVFSCAKLDCPEPILTQQTSTQSILPQPTTPTQLTSTRVVITLQPGSEGKDAQLTSTYPSDNFSSMTYLHARTWTTNGDVTLEEGIIQFDYSSIPAGAKITKATLTFFSDTTVDVGSVGHSQLSGSNDWTLKRVTQSWDEATVTWNTMPTTDPNNLLQCQASTSADEAYKLDVTSWVIDEISNPTSYYGFLMQINNETPYRAITFCSSDNKYKSLHPQMVIEYTE